MLGARKDTISETGATLREVPITRTRSTRARSWVKSRLWKEAGRASPKNVMSGFCHDFLAIERKKRNGKSHENDDNLPS